MKIALIYPNFLSREAFPPLGIAYLGSYLKKFGYSVSLLDATFYDGYERLSNELEKISPDIIGISYTSSLASFAHRCAKIAKELFPRVPVIAGGSHPTICPQESISHPFIDIVISGEGEYTLHRVLQGLESGDDIAQIPGVWVKNKDNKNNLLAPRGLIEDLDTIPYPDWEMFPNLSYYLQYSNNIFPILSGRGCPFRCSFCQPTLENLFGKKLRRRLPENVVDEIIQLKKRGARGFVFQDDTFTIDSNWIQQFCNLIIKNRVNLPWTCNSRVDTISEDMLILMKRAGLNKIGFGVESGSDRILNEVLKKDITVEAIKNVFALCHKHGILANTFLMLGSPSETVDDIKQTINLIRQIKPNWVISARTVLLPGTDLWDYALNNNLLLVGDKEAFRFHYSDFSLQTHRLGFSTAILRRLKNKLHLEWALITFNKKTVHKLLLISFALLGLIFPKLAKVLGAKLGKVLWVPPSIYS